MSRHSNYFTLNDNMKRESGFCSEKVQALCFRSPPLLDKVFETIFETNNETLFETNTKTPFPDHRFFFRPIFLKQIPSLFLRSIYKNMKKS